jgi:hypothetical protein
MTKETKVFLIKRLADFLVLGLLALFVLVIVDELQADSLSDAYTRISEESKNYNKYTSQCTSLSNAQTYYSDLKASYDAYKGSLTKTQQDDCEVSLNYMYQELNSQSTAGDNYKTYYSAQQYIFYHNLNAEEDGYWDLFQRDYLTYAQRNAYAASYLSNLDSENLWLPRMQSSIDRANAYGDEVYAIINPN